MIMLEIRGLSVEVGDKRILKDVNLNIEDGEFHVLLGPNGSGKTTLLLSILGSPRYKIIDGKIIFNGEAITDLPTHERVRLGMGIAFQHPPEIRGVKLADMISIAMKRRTGEIVPEIVRLAESLNFSREFIERDINLGFSGGEVKRSEILQLMAQNPDFIMLDEPDSGVDIENMELIGEEIAKLLDRKKMPSIRNRAGLIITHSTAILDYLEVDRAHVMLNGKVACSGNPREIIETIREEGYEKCIKMCQRR